MINAAARALRGASDDQVFGLLLGLVESRCLPRPIEVLGTYRRIEALPYLIAALADDIARPATEVAIRLDAESAIPQWLAAASAPLMVAGAETESSRRRRHATLTLLVEFGGLAITPADLRAQLMDDPHARLSVLGCQAALACGTGIEKPTAIRRLMKWLPRTFWPPRKEIERALLSMPMSPARTLLLRRAKRPSTALFSAARP